MKQGKIILIILGGFLLISVFAVVSIFGLFFSNVDKMKEQAARDLKEAQRIAALPQINGVIVADNYATPFSQQPAALSLVRFGREITYIGTRFQRGGRKLPRWGYSHIQGIFANPGAQINVGGKSYPIDFRKLILTRQGNKKEERLGYYGETFNPDKWRPDGFDYYSLTKDKQKIVTEKAREKFKHNIQILPRFEGFDVYLDSYIKDSLENHRQIHRTIDVTEIIYHNGDTIAFKGKIVGDKIIPLF